MTDRYAEGLRRAAEIVSLRSAVIRGARALTSVDRDLYDRCAAMLDKLAETILASIPPDPPPMASEDEATDCKIKFKEREVGHGRLTATNWVDHGCPWCTIKALEADRQMLVEALEPFAAMANVLGDDKIYTKWIGSNRWYHLRVSDLRRANAALAKARGAMIDCALSEPSS